ncbi:MAG: efflux RND transporter permease subunit, partial [Candidatus Hydrogenedentes bacterium]|nr:efflux RND transporter permease subunit [Candidatus Hydrogenedentota bacterium]
EWGVDMSAALGDVRDRMERLKPELPGDVDRMLLTRSGSDTQSMLSFTIFAENEDEDLAHWVHAQLRPRLTRIEGVASVDIWGAEPGSVYVEFNQDALRAANLSLYDVIAQLRRSHVDLAAGRIRDGETRHPIRVTSGVTSPDELADLVVGSNGLQLRNVATVRPSGPKVEFRHTIDGRQGVFVRVLKNADANTIDTCAAVREELELLKREPILEGLEVFVFEDQSRDMLMAIDMLINAGASGSLLALTVLFVFVRRLRPTIIVAASVPLSMVAGVIVMFFTGMTLNAVTLASLVICLGMLVDNSIVVMENILRYQEMGYGARESAQKGASEVSLAITMATLTTMVVFLPVFYIESGELSIYMRAFAVPVTVALAASLLVALTLVPLAASRVTARKARAPRGSNRLAPVHRVPRPASMFAWIGALRPLQRLLENYKRSLGFVLRWRFASTLVLGVLVAVTVAVPVRQVGTQTLPSVDLRMVEVHVQFDQTYDWTMAQGVFNAVESVMERQRSALAIENIFVSASAQGGEVRAYLAQPSGMDAADLYSTEDVSLILKAQLPHLIPGGEVRVQVVEAETGGGSTLTLRMRGEDAETLRDYARRFSVLLGDVPGVTDVMTDTERETDEIQLLVNETLASQIGVTPLVIAQTVDFALRGTRVFYLRQGGNELPVTAGFGEDDKHTVADLENVAVQSGAGALVPLAGLVTRQIADTPHAVTRIDGKNVVTIIARVASREASAVKADMEKLAAAFRMPAGYDIVQGERLAQLEVNEENYRVALLLAVVLIYVVMGALFESYLLPVSILASVPLAFGGVYWCMYLSGTPMDVISMIGAILLCGVIVNNGIVLVDQIIRQRAAGGDPITCSVRACGERFRPVMMTSLTTILGCAPLVAGSKIGTMGFSSVGWTLVGGLSAGTLLTLYVVPLFHAIFDDARAWFVKYFASVAALFQGKSGSV